VTLFTKPEVYNVYLDAARRVKNAQKMVKACEGRDLQGDLEGTDT